MGSIVAIQHPENHPPEVTMDRVRRRMLETSIGDIHYRECGSGGRPLVLLHWFPRSSRQFQAALPHLAARGYHAIALDVPGYGDSDPQPEGWGVPDLGVHLAECLDRLGLARAALLGGHNAGSIVTACAVASPDRVPALVIDGAAVWTEEERTGARPMPPADPPWDADGTPFRKVWDKTLRQMTHWAPSITATEEHAEVLHYQALDSLKASTMQAPRDGLRTWDLHGNVQRLTMPVLVLTAERETTRPWYGRALEIIPGARGHVFATEHPLLVRGEAATWAAVVADFLDQAWPTA